MNTESIQAIVQASISVKTKMLSDTELLERIHAAIDTSIFAFRNGGKLLFCGNGGSAADAQHIAAEFSGRFYKDREPLFAEALHVNGSYLTAVANDYGYDFVYERAVKAMGRKGDVLFAISTSGNSPNVLRAAQQAKRMELQVVGMTGNNGGKLATFCDILLNVPSTDTPRIQEAHILIGHIICQQVEEVLFP